MPIKASAKKELRKTKKRRIQNLQRIKTMKEMLKKTKKMILAAKAELSSGKREEAEKLISSTYQAIDKAVKSGVIKKNTAARKKSRLMKLLNKSAIK